ncbi:MAG TPA: competence/damage-inducible protein A, partial [Negativicutes bacterium]
TQGDITKEVAAQILNRPMYLHEASVKNIHCYFEQRHLQMPDNNLRQAMIAEGSIVVDNERGTAPGIILESGKKTIIHLPGPPHELEWMFEHSIAPYLKKRFGMQGAIISRVLHTYGIGESALEGKIKDFILTQSNPTIALLARQGEIIVRLTAKGATEVEAKKLIAELELAIQQRIGEYIFGADDDSMEVVIGRILADKQLTVALAESCTGGLVTSRITDIPGSSAYLTGSIVCYHNEIKVEDTGVPPQIIAEYGAVSEQTANCMAAGVRKKFNTDIGIGITGIAGPDGATPNKPVGLVFVAIDGSAGPQCQQYHFLGQRTDIKYRTSQSALNLLRQYALLL